MKIEHIAIYVNDLEGAKAFFCKYFDAKANALYHNKNTGFRSYFLSFTDGARLEIMNKPGIDNLEKPQNLAGYAHLAFSVGSKAQVDTLQRHYMTTDMRSSAGQEPPVTDITKAAS